MNVTIKFETKLNADSARQLNKHSLARLRWFLIIFSLFFIAIGIIGYLGREDELDSAMSIVLIVFGVLFTPIVWCVTMLLQKYINKTAKYITDETDEIYIFDEETLYIKQVSEKMQSESTYSYDYLYKVMESATHYFLYISKMQCHIVPKNSVTEGDINVLNDILRRKLGNKYSTKRF